MLECVSAIEDYLLATSATVKLVFSMRDSILPYIVSLLQISHSLIDTFNLRQLFCDPSYKVIGCWDHLEYALRTCRKKLPKHICSCLSLFSFLLNLSF